MKFANVGNRSALLLDHGFVDVATASGGRFGPDVARLYESWAEFASWAAGLLADAPSATSVGVGQPGYVEGRVDHADLGLISPSPRQVFAVGLNYASHAAESGRSLPTVPAVFTKFSSCLAAPYVDVPLVQGRHDYEAELVVIIGRAARHVSAADAWSVVAGIACGQDFSERITQNASGGHFSLGKSFPNFGPIGPYLVTPDSVPNPDDLAISCTVNDEVRQNSRTSKMVFGVPALIEHLSGIVTLHPGDVIFTGTPEGVGNAMTPPGLLSAGDVVTTTIEGIGTIRQVIV